MNRNPFQALYNLQQERLRKAKAVTPPEPAAETAEAKRSKLKQNKKPNKK